MPEDEFVENIDATPDKRILIAVSKDIDLRKGICEMIDNSIDNYYLQDKNSPLKISIFMDEVEQTIQYEDNSGGIKEENLNMIIQPGGTERTEEEETIGIFGIGTKRALIGLSRRSETISRFQGEDTFKIIVDEDWLNEKSWKIPKYRSRNIEQGKTFFSLQNLKFNFDATMIDELKRTIGEIYYHYFMRKNITIKLNGTTIRPEIFNEWSYPPNRCPRKYIFELQGQSGDPVHCEILVGLRLESSMIGKYGFDLYCNDRLIVKHLKDYRLGFRPGLLGSPHPTIARFYSIIKLNGKNKDMPWNSTKSDIDMLNPIYPQLEKLVEKFAKPYVQLSRRLSSSADEEILPYNSGTIEEIDLTSRNENENDFPDLPPARKSYYDKAISENREVLRNSPWTTGLLENILAVDMILKSKLGKKNRYALILLDSCLEIAFKEYLAKVLQIRQRQRREIRRSEMIAKIKEATDIDDIIWTKIDHFHELRNPLYHETASLDISDPDIEDFRNISCKVLEDLFNLSFEF